MTTMGLSVKFRTGFSIALVGAVGFSAASAQAMPLGTSANRLAADVAAAVTTAPSFDFRGIVALNDCSAALVRTSLSLPTDQAMVLTNGHCYEGGFLDGGQVLWHQPSTRTMKLFTEASPTGATAVLHATQVIYAAMTGTDITLYRLKETYSDIQSQYQVTAFLISDHHPTTLENINIVSGFWKKAYSCDLAAFIPQLREFNWTFTDSFRYSKPGCDIQPGSSGSPVLDATTHELVGINNTLNESGGRCSLDNPCEVDAQGNITVHRGAGYGQETYWLTTCLAPNGELDLTHEGCMLTKPQS